MTFEKTVSRHLPAGGVLLDAGCGRSAPVLRKFSGQASRLIGVDVVEPTGELSGVEYHCCDLTDIPVQADSVDVVMARSVMEHLDDPLRVYREFSRVLKPGGKLIFLTANLWDYVSLIAAVVPNRLHPWIVRVTEGRDEQDTFPTRFRSNTSRSIRRWGRESGLRIIDFEYLGQHPSYLQFFAPAYLLASWYALLISSVEALRCLRGWILCTMEKPFSAGD